MLSTRLRIILLTIVVCGAGLVAMVEFTEWTNLKAVTIDGAPVANPSRKLGFNTSNPVMKQPMESVAKLLLLSEQTARVDMDVDLTGAVNIVTNRFNPSGLVLDRVSGRMVGLNHDGRTVPLREDFDDWDHPIFTGVTVGKIFERCNDPRVSLIIPQLLELSDENRLLYRLIDEINLSRPEYVELIVSGLPYHLKVTADGFYDQVAGFFEFMELYKTRIDTSLLVDLRFSNLIVQERPADTSKSKHKTDTVDHGAY